VNKVSDLFNFPFSMLMTIFAILVVLLEELLVAHQSCESEEHVADESTLKQAE